MRTTRFMAVLFLTCLTLAACAQAADETLTKVEFVEINLSEASIEEYPFLLALSKEIKETRKKFSDTTSSDLRWEGKQFTPPRIYLAETSINNRDVIVTSARGGVPNIYCSNSGCAFSIYVKSHDGFTPAGSISGNEPLLKAACESEDYVVVGTGPGTNQPSLAVWKLEDTKPEYVRGANASDVNSICNDQQGGN